MMPILMDVTYDAINSAFQALFYGEGSWLGWLLIISISLGLMLKWKYSGVLLLPGLTFMGINYLTYDLAWQALVTFFSVIFLLFYMAKQLKG